MISTEIQPTEYVTRQTSTVIALTIVALGFGLRLYTLDSESLWYDELLQLDIAQGPLAKIFPRLRGHSAVPLDYLISHFWITLGRSDGWVRLPAVIAGTVVLPLAYQLGRRLLGRVEGLVFMTLLAISPFHIHFSQEVRPYALVVLGVTLTGYGFWRLRDTGKWRYFIPLQLGVLISLLTHIFAAVILFPLCILMATDIMSSRNRRRSLQLLVALGLSGLAPLLVFVVMGWGDVIFYTSKVFGEALIQPEKFSMNTSQASKSITGPIVNWPFIRDQIMDPLAAYATLPLHSFPTGEKSVSLQTNAAQLPSLLLFNTLVVLGLVNLLSDRRPKLALLLLLWLFLPPIVIVTFLVFRGTFFASRYVISVLPAYLLLLTVGTLVLPRWLNRAGFRRLSILIFLVIIGFMFASFAGGLDRLFHYKNKENWHLAGDFIAENAGPNDAIIAFRAEPAMNWYYPQAWAAPNSFKNLESIQAAVAQAERSWIILSIFSSDTDAKVRAWLSEQQAVRIVLDPIVHVYYLGHQVPSDQLLAEIQDFALPVDHALYASLARENRRRPEVARQYYELAIEHAPDDDTRLGYEAALEAVAP